MQQWYSSKTSAKNINTKMKYRAVFTYQHNNLLFIQSSKVESTMSKESDTHLDVLDAWVLHHCPYVPSGISKLFYSLQRWGGSHCHLLHWNPEIQAVFIFSAHHSNAIVWTDTTRNKDLPWAAHKKTGSVAPAHLVWTSPRAHFTLCRWNSLHALYVYQRMPR